MRITNRFKLFVVLWVVAEFVAFDLVVQWIGFGDAILVGLLSSLFGYSLLRRAGSAAFAKLRTRLDGGRIGGEGLTFLNETLATFGAVALLVPGFLSDIVGLALAVPAIRASIGKRLGRSPAFDRSRAWTGEGSDGPSRHGPAVIDLEPGEWRAGDPAGRPLREV